MDKWQVGEESFWDWLKGTPPDPGDPDFVGPPTMEEHFDTPSLLNPFTSTRIDNYIILLALLYGVYRFSK